MGKIKPLRKVIVIVLVSLALLLPFCQLQSVKPETSSIEDQSNPTFIDVAREVLQTHQNQTGLDSTGMIGMLDMINHVSLGWQRWASTYGNFSLQIWYYVPPPNDTRMGITALMWWYNQEHPWVNIIIENGLLDHIQDFREIDNASSTQINFTKEQAESIATENIKSYSYTALNGSVVSGFTISQNSTTTNLLNNERDGLLSPCWVVIFTLNQTYPDSVSQLFVEVWADTGEIFTIGNLAPSHLITIENPYPPTSPTPTPTPTTSQSPSATPSPSPSPSQTPSQPPTPSPTAKISPTITPSPSQSLLPSQEPTSSPNQQPSLQETYYIVALVAAIAIVAAVALALKKRQSKQKITQLSGASA